MKIGPLRVVITQGRQWICTQLFVLLEIFWHNSLIQIYRVRLGSLVESEREAEVIVGMWVVLNMDISTLYDIVEDFDSSVDQLIDVSMNFLVA